MKRLIPVLALLLIVPGVALGADKAVIIGFRQRPGASERTLVQRARGRIERNFQLIPAVAASVPEGEIKNLRRNRAIAYVEENAVYMADATSPGDVEGANSWQVSRTSADVAHASGNMGTGVKVAVLDTGIDYTHEDLDGNFRGGYDFVFSDNDPFDDSYNSHGTHMAGIIAAEKNGTGVVGIAPEAELYAVKVLDGAGFGRVDWVIAGIEWAVSHGVDVINMSLSGPDTQALREACERARGAGVLLVAAGGNSLAGGGPVWYPAAYDSVIAVTATDEFDLPGYFAPLGNALELTAPGVDIFSTAAGGNYRSLSGTSQAAACVSGAAALYIRSLMEDLNGDRLVNNEDVRLMLQLTALDLGNQGRDPIYGYGLVNTLAASLDSPATLTLTKTRATSTDDRVVAKLTDAVYRVVINNSGLRKVVVDVFEGETHRTDLSRTILFEQNPLRQRVALRMGAIDTSYLVVFTPYGRAGTSASVDIRRVRR
ncbi:MAG: S8 family serine peptidase [Pirellulaceae bacterium]